VSSTATQSRAPSASTFMSLVSLLCNTQIVSSVLNKDSHQTINTCTNSNSARPRVQLQINNQIVDALYDTGAAATVFPTELFRKLFPKGHRPPKIPSTKTFSSASGNIMKVDGTYMIQMTYLGRTFQETVHVISNCNEPLLGITLANEHQLEYDTKFRKVIFRDMRDDWNNAQVATVSQVTIPALTSQRVKLSTLSDLGSKIPEGTEALCTISTFQQKELSGPPAWVKVDRKNQISMILENCSPYAITIPANTVLGLVEACGKGKSEKLEPEFIDALTKSIEQPNIAMTKEEIQQNSDSTSARRIQSKIFGFTIPLLQYLCISQE